MLAEGLGLSGIVSILFTGIVRVVYEVQHIISYILKLSNGSVVLSRL